MRPNTDMHYALAAAVTRTRFDSLAMLSNPYVAHKFSLDKMVFRRADDN